MAKLDHKWLLNLGAMGSTHKGHEMRTASGNHRKRGRKSKSQNFPRMGAGGHKEWRRGGTPVYEDTCRVESRSGAGRRPPRRKRARSGNQPAKGGGHRADRMAKHLGSHTGTSRRVATLANCAKDDADTRGRDAQNVEDLQVAHWFGTGSIAPEAFGTLFGRVYLDLGLFLLSLRSSWQVVGRNGMLQLLFEFKSQWEIPNNRFTSNDIPHLGEVAHASR